jgi:hypothetical protein
VRDRLDRRELTSPKGTEMMEFTGFARIPERKQ